jgi:L-threonylcarbamoyladenylate synthase
MPEPPTALPPFLRDNEADLARAAALLRSGEIVALPTETVYGLAADALNEAAVRRIFSAKGRPLIDPLIVHVASLESVAQLAEIPPALERLAARFWPGPLTVVLRKKPVVPDLVTAGCPTVAVRFPAHPLMQKVIRLSGCFLAAPSANPFGYISPTRAAHVRESLGERAPWILDGGECEHGLESTIVHLSDPAGPRLLRPGPVSGEALEAVLGVPLAVAEPKAAEAKAQVAPGMLSRHYSPRTRVLLRAPGEAPALRAGLAGQAVVWVRRPSRKLPGADAPAEFWLSEDGDVREVARNVFALLRRLDAGNFTLLHLELAEGGGLATAINDRLRRAAARKAEG